MPEEINNRKVFSLYEVAKSIEKTIADRYKSSYWIKAELNKLNYYHHSGHCYPELVEKRENKIIAQIRANLWRDDYFRINNTFKKVLNEPLKDGIKILFLASINYHPEYGLSLHIIDIDPGYTMGDLEKEKQDTIKKLREEGLFDKNKLVPLPVLPQRIAIISVESSKGYADFLKVLEGAHDAWKYKFFHLLFPSLLQGDAAAPSIIRQLHRIKKVISHFDVVAIVRGGGGDIGLSCYNNYLLAKEIASFPIPVITGIGHATNETVAEMISYENAITPTKLAEFVIQKFHDFAVPVRSAEEKITDRAYRLLLEEKNRFRSETRLFRTVTGNLLLKNRTTLKESAKSLIHQSNFIFRSEYEYHKNVQQKIVRGTAVYCASFRQNLMQYGESLKKDLHVFFKDKNVELNNIEINVNNMRPENVLKRGYSITYLNENSVSDFSSVKKGDVIRTILNKGTIESTVNSTSKSPKNE